MMNPIWKFLGLSILGLGLVGCTSCKCSNSVQKIEEPTSVNADHANPPKDANDRKMAQPPAPEKPDAIPDNAEEPSEAVIDDSNPNEKVIKRTSSHVSIEMHYPKLGSEIIDHALEKMVTDLANDSERRLKNMASDSGDFQGAIDKYESGMFYEVIRNQPDAADVLLSQTEYTGGAHEALSLHTVMLDGDGNEVDPWSLFKDPDAELEKISQAARAQLKEQLSNYEDVDSMIEKGTAPKRENFKHMVRTDKGVRIYFDPYSIAPWAEGVLSIDYDMP